MFQVKQILDKIDRLFNMGFLSHPYTVHLNDVDYEEAWKDAGNCAPSTTDEFYLTGPSGGVYFKKQKPDYVDGHTYYYFDHKQSISDYGHSFGHEVQVVKLDACGDWVRYDWNGASITIPYYIQEQLKKALFGGKVESKETKKTCWHTGKTAVYLFVSAYWRCDNCHADCGTLTDEEFYKNIKGR